MKNLTEYISEGYDMLGHVVKVGDWIQFQSAGLKLWGEVEEIIPGDKEKYVIKTLGWYGDESQRSQVKLSYKVNANSKSLYLLNKVKK